MTAEHQEIIPSREGVRFRAQAIDSSTLTLYIEGQDDPIHSGGVYIPNIKGVEEIFQQLVSSRDLSVIRDPHHLGIVQLYAQEKAADVALEQKTYRFLQARENELVDMPGDPRLAFILTTDKGDIEEVRQRKAGREEQARAEEELYQKALAGEQIVEIKPLTEEEMQLLEKIKEAEILHCFVRGALNPSLAYFDTNVIAYIPHWNKVGLEPRELTAQEIQLFQERAWLNKILTDEETKILEWAKFSPTKDAMYGSYFFGLLVRGGLVTNQQLKELFPDASENFDVINWRVFNWQRWPHFDREGKSMAALAKLLGKAGIQRYAWDGGYGDISESWRTVFIDAEGNLMLENTQTYGGIFA